MHEVVTPKIFLNEEYIDLRKHPDNSISSKRSASGTAATRQKDNYSVRTTNLKCEGLRLEKELINCGLKKLVTSYNATASANVTPRQHIINKKKPRTKENTMFDPRFRRFVVPDEKHCLKSQSEISIVPKGMSMDQARTSAPVFQNKKTTNIEVRNEQNKYEPRNKGTMTKEDNQKGHNLKQKKKSNFTHKRARSKDYREKQIQNKPAIPHQEFIVNQQYIDPRLCEKYSILKMPWRGTWTIPVFSPKSSAPDINKKFDNFDRQTYLYDDGTDIDSVYVENRKQHLGKVIQNQCMTILFASGSLCGILLASLLIWCIFGSDFFSIFFKPKDAHDGSFTWYIKYVTGGTIHLITNVFKAIGRILATPIPQGIRPPPDKFKWHAVRH